MFHKTSVKKHVGWSAALSLLCMVFYGSPSALLLETKLHLSTVFLLLFLFSFSNKICLREAELLLHMVSGHGHTGSEWEQQCWFMFFPPIVLGQWKQDRREAWPALDAQRQDRQGIEGYEAQSENQLQIM